MSHQVEKIFKKKHQTYLAPYAASSARFLFQKVSQFMGPKKHRTVSGKNKHIPRNPPSEWIPWKRGTLQQQPGINSTNAVIFRNKLTGHLNQEISEREFGGALRIQVCPKNPGSPRSIPIPRMGLEPAKIRFDPGGVWIRSEVDLILHHSKWGFIIFGWWSTLIAIKCVVNFREFWFFLNPMLPAIPEPAWSTKHRSFQAYLHKVFFLVFGWYDFCWWSSKSYLPKNKGGEGVIKETYGFLYTLT